MDLEIKLRGFKELEQLLRELPAKIARRELTKALKEAARPMLLAAKALAPVLAKSTAVRTSGLLRRSIRLRTLRKPGGSLSRAVTIGVRKSSGKKSTDRNDPFYWYFLERGTKKMRARPFLQPAFDAHHARFLENFRTRLFARIEAYWKRG